MIGVEERKKKGRERERERKRGGVAPRECGRKTWSVKGKQHKKTSSIACTVSVVFFSAYGPHGPDITLHDRHALRGRKTPRGREGKGVKDGLTNKHNSPLLTPCSRSPPPLQAQCTTLSISLGLGSEGVAKCRVLLEGKGRAEHSTAISRS